MFELKKVAIIGAGTMGAGIAQWFAQAGIATELSDIDSDVRKLALEKVHASWDKLQAKNKFTSEQVSNFKNLLTTSPIDQISTDTDLCIEAIIENLEIKNKVFKNLDHYFDKKTIIASNTSSIPIDSMAKELSEKRKSQFLGLHFFNPAPIMKLVEVVQGHWSDPTICHDLYSWFTEQGKKPAHCKDGPGFIVNRVARNFYGEPFRIIKSADHKKIEEVDCVLKNVGGFRMGPFELMDLIGIDINYSVSQSVWKSFYHEARFAPHAIQKQMVQSGRFGRKTKEGFYKYE